MKNAILVSAFVAGILATTAMARPVPHKALLERMQSGPEVIAICHFGLNTYTDREWGYGDENPALFNPAKFDANQIVQACKAGGIGGIVVVAKHHDGFCLWPTKTTEHNIGKSPFRNGKGDYVREMADACRKAGLKFGVYVSPWDRNNAHYATEKYVEIFHEQLRELLNGSYGDVFEMWFDGANGGTGYYGGARERRSISRDYYRYPDGFRLVRSLQPGITIFCGENDSEFRWPGNERGVLDDNSRATIVSKYNATEYKKQINTGSVDGEYFRVAEADFPLRKAWFWHAKDKATVKSAAYLAKLYCGTVGNGGTMDIGIAPNKDGLLSDEDVRALAGFGTMQRALFAREVTKDGEEFNVVEMREDLSNGEQVDGWRILADGEEILSGTAIGNRRIRLLPKAIAPKKVELQITKDGGKLLPVKLRRYNADPSLVATILEATTNSGETDTAKWMTQGAPDDCPVSMNVR